MNKKILDFLDRHLALIFILPISLTIGGICLYPVAYSVWLSFTNYHLIYGISKFFTLENYLRLLSDPRFWTSLWNNVVWLAGSIFFQLVIGAAVALALDQRIRGKRIWEALIVVPWAFSCFAFVFTWKWMLAPVAGVVNYILLWLHFIPLPVAWLGGESTAMLSVIQIGVWNGIPFIMLTIQAGLQTIPKSDYDVAKIEGASYPQIFRYVIFPRIKKIVGIIVILKSIWIFNWFDLIFLATGGGPLIATQTVPLYAYVQAWDRLQIARGAAATTFLLVILVVMTVIYFRLFKIEE